MGDQRANAYVLFKFVDTQNFGIGTLDSIAIPKGFQKKNFLNKMKDVNKFISQKSQVGVRWPGDGSDWSLPPNDQRAVQEDMTMMQAEIISFSEDHTTLVGTRDALLESRKKPAKPVTNFYANSLPKAKSGKGSPATPTQKVLAEKSLNIPSTQKASSSSSPGEAFAKKSTPKVIAPIVKEAQQRSLDKGGKSDDDDLGVSPLESSDSEEEENVVTPKKKTTGREKGTASDEDMFASSESEADESPPPQKRKSPSKTSSASKIRKIQEHKELLEKLEASKKAIEEDSQDSTLALEQLPADELVKMVQGLKKELANSILNFEYERDQFTDELEKKNSIIKEKEAEIVVLKQDNPLVLAQSLKEGLLALQMISPGGGSSTTSTPRAETPSSNSPILVKLDNDCDLLISKHVLRNAIAYGRSGKQRVHRNKMVSTLMKGLWDREFMACHSVSGRKSPTDKSTDPPKPAIPADALQAIQNFTISFWKLQHNKAIKTTQVNQSIAYKLGREQTAKKKSEGGMQDAAA